MKRLRTAAVLIGSTLVCGPSFAQSTAGTTSTKIGAWTFEITTDQMTDKVGASITTKSADGEFSFQCEAAGPKTIYPVMLSTQFLGGSGGDYARREIMLRFDNDAPLTPTWFYKERLTFIPHDPDQTTALMTRSISAQKLAVRAITYDSQYVNASFDFAGAASAIAKLRQVCEDPA